MKFNHYTQTAVQAALAGGEVLMKYFHRSITVDFKGAIDPVTVADRTSQETIKRKILKKYPAHSIIGEEDTEHASCEEYCWIIDPLDGTVNFIHGLPIFAVSIALQHEGEIVSGVVYAPALKEMFIAERGKGAWCNGRKIRVSATGSLLRALTVTGFPYYVQADPDRVVRNFVQVLMKAQGVRRLGSAALDLAYVAAGRFEAFWEEGLAPWDVAAGSLVVTEAGGRVSDYRGKKDYINGRQILASNGVIHRKMLNLICEREEQTAVKGSRQ
jgi:myo-inositol-1(or 4)-monophosphatase